LLTVYLDNATLISGFVDIASERSKSL
jgi:hypothetical protein